MHLAYIWVIANLAVCGCHPLFCVNGRCWPCLSSFSFFCWRHHWIELPQHGWIFHHVTGLQNLGLLRLFNFMLWGIVMLCVGRFFALHKWMIFRPLAFLGRHSLQVYSYHVLLLFMLYLTIDFWNSPQSGLQGVAIATLLLSLWLPAGLHACYQNFKTRMPSHAPSH